jgi:hypothetical protein
VLDKHEEDHVRRNFSPATGGKKIARIPRKMSEPHMVAFEEGMGYLTKRTV